jgi:hexosaminidase
MRTQLLFPLFVCIWICPIHAAPRTIPIVPKPRLIKDLGGSVVFAPAQTSIRLAVRDTAGIAPAVEDICSTSVALYGNAPVFNRKSNLTIWAGVAGVDPAFDSLCARKRLLADQRLGEEGYTLTIEPRRILVAAGGMHGLFYGLESLNQLIRGFAVFKGRMPAVEIRDWPDMHVRAVMDDISRGPVPSPEFLRRQIRRYAEMKINTILYYTEHVVLTERHPDFAPPGGALSIAEWRGLSDYAKRLHVNLVGNFQSFGHFEKILATPHYAHLGDGKSLLSPALEESYDFLRDVYQEMVPAFDASFFNVNCDETFELGQGRSKSLVDSLGKGRVYLNHILRIRKMLQDLGVRAMIWGDILLQYPEMIDQVPRDVIIGTWTYDTLANYHEYIRPFTSRGFDVLVTPGVLNSRNIVPNFRQSLVNIERFVRDGIAQNVMGALMTVWDDGGTALFSTDWYGVAFAADRMWNCDTLDRTFDDRFDLALYGDRAHALSRGIESLMHLADFAPTDGMNEKTPWSPVIPAKYQKLRLNALEWDSVLATARRAEAVLETGKPLLDQGDIEAMRFITELYQGAAHLCLGMRDASRLYRRALEMETTHSRTSRSLLVSAWENVSDLRLEFSRLKRWYAKLWLAENRMYSLDLIERVYDERINDLADVEKGLRDAVTAMDKGERLPSADAVRLDIIESTGWYFKDWLVTGPIAGNDVKADYLVHMGGESWKTPPRVTQEFFCDGKTYRWSRLSALTSAEIDLNTLYPGAREATLYAYATLESPETATVPALLGLGGSGRVVVNGAGVFERARGDSLTVDGDTVRLPLVRGMNHLLIKICGFTPGSWGFSVRLPESAVRNRKNRYRIIQQKQQISYSVTH